eukprot:m.445440 g.445440  ORF g.445440 m.445440 type:complete len:245 (-) comp20305_c0_seq1:377-1111(-)
MMAAPVTASGPWYLSVPRGLAIALAFAIASTLFFIIGYSTNNWVELDAGGGDASGGLFRLCFQSSCTDINFDCFDSEFEDESIACGEHAGAVATGAIAILLLLVSTSLLAQKLVVAARSQTAVTGFGPVVGMQCGAALFMTVTLVTGRLFYDKVSGDADLDIGWSFNLVICSIVWLIASVCCFAAYKRQVTVVVAASTVQYEQTASQSMYPPQQQQYQQQQQPPAYAQPSPYGQAEKAPLLGQQ